PDLPEHVARLVHEPDELGVEVTEERSGEARRRLRVDVGGSGSEEVAAGEGPEAMSSRRTAAAQEVRHGPPGTVGPTMALAVCLLLAPADERALAGLWRRVEAAGVPSMSSHTHGRHLPHLSYAVLRSWDLAAVRDAVAGLPDRGPVTLHLAAVATAPRGRSWLVPAASADLVERQRAVVEAVTATGAELHRHYVPGRWLPHVSL